MTGTATKDRIELSPLNVAIFTRYHTQLASMKSLVKVFDDLVGDTDAEMSRCSQLLAFLQERLVQQRELLVNATAGAEEANQLLRTVMAQLAAMEEVEIEQYELDVTPNGTVTSLSRKM